MLHPDYIEEMDYAVNARYDYIMEAFGDTAIKEDFDYGEEEDDFIGPCEPQYDLHVQNCVRVLLWGMYVVFHEGEDNFPF